MNIKNFIQSRVFRGILIGLAIAVAILVIFQAGVFIGYRKATFGHHFGDNFERNFKDPKGMSFGFRGGPAGMGMPGGHGAAGKIVSIALPLIVVAGPDNLEKTLVIDEDTEIREFQNTITKDKLQVGDFIIVLGTPNEAGEIEAKLIRLAPVPQDNL
ncbi:MAG: hypothetical protein A2566_01440 [Candidatus Zambryskibacteria bacterium RIFOXYD1_FULL_40_13]|nr:MAG: hypothetical protein UT25_C0005G0027 [Parcubacteria group bacterium GW2011_GWC1_39_12]KKR19188.1 MAG: hypothetical protein UT49_C0002G0034 [Parcubacteria group bacterium GW2011_GWF1_39_37]KKR34882.1 MAG: hypothetical protein UT68_C0007G0033 [Parcubacteria group bacterium GW2011_GWC2_40_10]KKR52125.1 MAG: hypothetical protein UT89_C0003G0061 [Parcubacteria group bacterium GW2011_GWE1_40_20]KKR66124.1 MAG: hypothetical protein UU06_C0005G0014 [Parcubacteria group bacterium GW2011_GWB1_40_